MANNKAIQGYGRGAIETELSYASPHRIIQMLMEATLTKLATAKGCIERGEIAEKSRQISWAMNIIQGLRSSLNGEQGGEVAANLDALYEYMGRQLLEANVHDNIAILDEVTQLIAEIKGGWDAIPPEFHNS